MDHWIEHISEIPDPPMYFDIEGTPISMERWVALLHMREYKVVGWDQIHVRGTRVTVEDYEGTLHMQGIVTVSTVWIGLDHGWFGGPPLIFETMIFGGAHDEDQWRYSTHDQAVQGHAAAVALVRAEAALFNSPLEAESPAPEPPSDR